MQTGDGEEDQGGNRSRRRSRSGNELKAVSRRRTVFESTALAMLSLAQPCSAHGEGSRHWLPLKVHLASLGYRLPLRRDHAWSTIPARASVIGISGLTDPLSVTAGSARTMLETSTHPTTPNTSDVPTVSPNLRGKLMLVRTKNTNAPTAAHRTASIST
jgi:hypothetical protein